MENVRLFAAAFAAVFFVGCAGGILAYDENPDDFQRIFVPETSMASGEME